MFTHIAPNVIFGPVVVPSTFCTLFPWVHIALYTLVDPWHSLVLVYVECYKKVIIKVTCYSQKCNRNECI